MAVLKTLVSGAGSHARQNDHSPGAGHRLQTAAAGTGARRSPAFFIFPISYLQLQYELKRLI